MNEEQAKALRAPFDESLISPLPKVTCKNCTDSRSKNCDQHQKSRCQVCGSWITTAHIHLSYVGHAETTDRLLSVDPEWFWEPVAFGPDGLPLLDGNGGLWMRLTVGGVTRLGYGDAQGKNGPNAVKEAIGDGIRNAAMRFGVALDLWAKSDLAAIHADKETGEIAGPAEPRQSQSQSRPPAEPERSTAKQELWAHVQQLGWSATKLAEEFLSWSKAGDADSVGIQLRDATDEQLRQFLADLRSEQAA